METRAGGNAMRTKYENRGGEEVVTEMTTADPCPECCGGLEAQGDPKNPRYLRCTSCGLIFRPLKEEG